ncbi:MAG: glycoside hydrolase family 3 C-terminal domain-containing protein, partial [bacterium]
NAAAILEAFYPGNQGGMAVAKILAGKVNPSAHLPYSIPRGVGYLNCWYYQRPSKYSKGQYSMTPKNDGMYPLYDFGYGLSYTKFEYSEITVLPKIKKSEKIELSVTITNIGKYDGEEVVLLFVNDEISRVTTPVKLLKDYKRIFLKKGESSKVTFVLNPDQLIFLNEQLKPELDPGMFTLMVGDKKARFEIVN